MENHQKINQDSGCQEYYTPFYIVEAARSVLGIIDLDPASCEKANKVVKATKYYTKRDDGLLYTWKGRVWMNHPFSKKNNPIFINKLLNEYMDGNVVAACCICFAATSEKWFQPLLYYPQCFLFGRTNYIKEDGTITKDVTKGSVVTYLGNDVECFKNIFHNKLGVVKI